MQQGRSHPRQRRRPRGRAARRVRAPPPGEVQGHRAAHRAPRRRHRRVEVPRLPHPQRRAQRGGRPSARGVRDGPDQLRRAAPRHLRREAARARHVGQRPARLAQLPVAARVRGPPVRQRSTTRTPRSRCAARTTTGTSTSGAGTRPSASSRSPIPPIWDPQAIADEVHRVAKKGCHAITFPENPVPLGPPELPHRPLGPGVDGVPATRAPSCACTSARRGSSRSPRPTPRSTC